MKFWLANGLEHIAFWFYLKFPGVRSIDRLWAWSWGVMTSCERKQTRLYKSYCQEHDFDLED